MFDNEYCIQVHLLSFRVFVEGRRRARGWWGGVGVGGGGGEGGSACLANAEELDFVFKYI